MVRMVTSTSALPWSRRNSGVIVGVLAFGLVVMMAVPLEPVTLHMSIAANAAVAVFVLMSWPYIGRPLGLREAVVALLALTVVRLATNVVATRLILSRGSVVSGTGADVGGLGNVGGNFIPAIAKFVTRFDFVVALAVWAIIFTVVRLVVKRDAGPGDPFEES